MTDYALSTFESGQILFAGTKASKLSVGRRLLLWIESTQQLKADREIALVCARHGIKLEERRGGNGSHH